MNSTTSDKSLATLKTEMDAANLALKKAVRKARVPSDFKTQEVAAKAAYRAYWAAVDAGVK